MIHATEKSLKEMGEKVSGEERKNIEDAIVALKDVLKGDDKAQIESKTQALAEASGKLAERMYAQQGEGAEKPQGKGQTAESAAGDDVVDAEFEEVDDRKK